MEGLLVFGRTGQVARELARLAPDARFAGRDMADLSRPADCAALIRATAPRAVINAAAWTAVDKAEVEAEAAQTVNADAPGAMATACADMGISFLHVSTDYVFDGSGDAPRDEDAPTNPLNVYGATKLAGEQAVAAAGGHWAILRTSWVFSAHGANFLRTMLRLGAERPRLTVVADQVGGPTPAWSIAAALLSMADQMRGDSDKSGLFHFAGRPDVSWAGFAREIMAKAGLPAVIEDIPTTAYPTPATRPLNSRLDCGRVRRVFGIERPDWRDALAHILAEPKDSA